MTPTAVLDTNVIVSGIGWQGDARTVLRLLGRHVFVSVRTPYLTQEWSETLLKMSVRVEWQNPNWESWLDWLKASSRLIADAPAKLIVRRDLKDNPILAAAISHGAGSVVTQDKDMLDLQKPYGVQCVTPRTFIREVLLIA